MSRGVRDLFVGLAALAGIVAWEISALDLAVMGWFGAGAGFPWRDTWFLRDFLHNGGRWMTGVILVLLGAWALFASPPQGRMERLFWFGVTATCLIAIPALKRLSASSCPWDLQPFGGPWPYVPHWIAGTVDGGPGHCFPAGHAAAAFAFLGAYFMLRESRPRAAAVTLGAVLTYGIALGGAQVMRGAHFVSHTLWSAWLCWMLCTVAAGGISLRMRVWRTAPSTTSRISTSCSLR